MPNSSPLLRLPAPSREFGMRFGRRHPSRRVRWHAEGSPVAADGWAVGRPSGRLPEVRWAPAGEAPTAQNRFCASTDIQVVKASHYVAVKYKDIKEILQVEGIRINIINSNQILFLRCRQTKKDTGSRKGHCKRCNWPLDNKGSYCSIECMLLEKSPHLQVELAECNNPSTSFSSAKLTGTSQRRKLERGKSTMQSVLEASEVCNMNLLTCIDIGTHIHAFPLIRDLFLPKVVVLSTLPSIRWMIIFCVSVTHRLTVCSVLRRCQGTSQRRKLERGKSTMQASEVPVKLLHGEAEPPEIEPACPSKEVAGSSEIEAIHKKDALNYRTWSRKGTPCRSPLF
uniref:Uncharacterized protein n=1 Tax=Ananas comosus var. bracteatus TaxID=296719 RepID=A0A6V7QHA9_ANACO|nr:unnamed protein product [Ananas comosus var. bracteatus]